MDNITNVTGSGIVSPSTTADIHWLIIPARGAANEVPQGTLYYVGATLTYTIGGEEHVTEVMPDYIYVKPMPELTLDYFIPHDVYGDDAFTAEIEPPVPFSLGVRVTNAGFGTARQLKIDSAQPRIIDNELGLLVGFTITGSTVNGSEATASLLADFGDIEPNTSGVARWIMTCSLSGEFTEFTADFIHSDELGGELTSLLAANNTHFLVHDVLVDLPGRDGVSDFLAEDTPDSGFFQVYESDNLTTAVTNQSAVSSLSGSGNTYTLFTSATPGCMYVKLPDPHAGQMILQKVVRSDGKRIQAANAWLSKSRDGDNNWLYYVNLFDVNTTNSYTLSFGEPPASPQAPILQFIPDLNGVEGMLLSFLVEASDPDGTIPALSTGKLPINAIFTDNNNGSGVFTWSPAGGQAGRYTILFTASDGTLADSQNVVLTINPVNDRDGDGLLNDLEDATCTNPDNPDTDNDGINDGVEDANHNGIVDPGETNPCDPDFYPVASAGPDRNAGVHRIVFLDGTDSYDPDGQLIDYLWTFISVPSGSMVTDSSLSDQQSPNPAFVPDVAGEYVLEVEVSDGIFSSSDEVTLNVSVVNVAPNAEAGPDQNALSEAAVMLDGKESYDPDNGPGLLSYLWSFNAVPTFSLLTDNDITGRDQPVAEFVPDSIGDYELKLTVNDGASSDSDTLKIFTGDQDIAPNAHAGADLWITLGETAVLDGHASNDPDNSPNPCTFTWQLVSRPAGSSISRADIEEADSAAPVFVPDHTGTYVLRITVTDGEQEDSDNVAVVVSNSADLDNDGDVDGKDLVDSAAKNLGWYELFEFASQFGKKF
jgi:hypothetical protein